MTKQEIHIAGINSRNINLWMERLPSQLNAHSLNALYAFQQAYSK